MGIFTSRHEQCKKCGEMTIFDGPYSDCGCFSPPGPSPEEVIMRRERTNLVEKETKLASAQHRDITANIRRGIEEAKEVEDNHSNITALNY